MCARIDRDYAITIPLHLREHHTLAQLCNGVPRYVVEYPHAGGASDLYVSVVPLLQVSRASGEEPRDGRAMNPMRVAI